MEKWSMNPNGSIVMVNMDIDAKKIQQGRAAWREETENSMIVVGG